MLQRPPEEEVFPVLYLVLSGIFLVLSGIFFVVWYSCAGGDIVTIEAHNETLREISAQLDKATTTTRSLSLDLFISGSFVSLAVSQSLFYLLCKLV